MCFDCAHLTTQAFSCTNVPAMSKSIPQATIDRIKASAADYVFWQVATIAPLSRLCVRFGNIAAFKPNGAK